MKFILTLMLMVAFNCVFFLICEPSTPLAIFVGFLIGAVSVFFADVLVEVAGVDG